MFRTQKCEKIRLARSALSQSFIIEFLKFLVF